jgi:Domain of unknown function (DUF1707)
VPGSAPGGPRRLAGEADRERLVALLREHYALGQLDDDELDRRVGAVLGARYMDEAASAVTDLPQLEAPGAAGGRPARRRRGHAQAARPAAGWIPTDERFRDPTTRAVMRVWIDPADQSRHYVPEPGA